MSLYNIKYNIIRILLYVLNFEDIGYKANLKYFVLFKLFPNLFFYTIHGRVDT